MDLFRSAMISIFLFKAASLVRMLATTVVDLAHKPTTHMT